MSGEWDGLRAAAEAATAGPWGWDSWKARGDELAYACVHGPDAHDIATLTGSNVPPPLDHDDEIDDAEWASRRIAAAERDATYIAAASPDVVLGLLDRLQAAEAAVERVRAVVAELRRPDMSLVGRIMSPSLRTIADALEGHESGVTGSLGPPQAEVALGASLGPEGAQGASGAESDHGGRGDGEGLG